MNIEKLGPYRIERQIGKGGMGAVYAAVYEPPGEGAGTAVAVKSLSPQLALAEGFRERFEAEIDSLKKLKHEGIVRLYGYGEQDGILFYSMELVEGTSLEEEINKGRRFTWHETLQIGIQVCRALKHAHDHGVVHRDIKPANLMLTPEGRIKIADFGIARLFGGTQLTTAGGVLGTADYMSPEQADGRSVTEKCDQYSLGGVMYGLLAGRPPFRAKTMPEMLQLQRFAEPDPVRRYAPETPDQLERLISQLLSKDPESRFPNVLVLGRHMEAMDKALSRKAEQAPGAEEPEQAPVPSSMTPEQIGTASGGSTDVDNKVVLDFDPNKDSSSIDLYDAPTLAQTPSESATSSEKSTPTIAPSTTAGGGSRFTTIDDEVRRQSDADRDSMWMLALKLAPLLLLLAGVVWGVWWLMKPYTADELYDRIQATVDQAGTDDLRVISSELNDFMQRFPHDPRREELEPYLDQLESQKLERQARVRARFAGSASLGPIESAYLDAVALSRDDPARAHARLTNLLTLYDPENVTANDPSNGTDNTLDGLDEEQRRWLSLSRQELNKLEERLNEQADTQRPLIERQLRAAHQLSRRQPAQAARMYEAIIKLYGEQPWLASVVDEAKQALAQLQSTESETPDTESE